MCVFVDDTKKFSVAKPQEFDGYCARIKQRGTRENKSLWGRTKDVKTVSGRSS